MFIFIIISTIYYESIRARRNLHKSIIFDLYSDNDGWAVVLLYTIQKKFPRYHYFYDSCKIRYY